MPYIGTISVLTFNLINSLAKKQTRSNALFWLTVWLTAEVQGSSVGVTGAVCQSDLDIGQGVGADNWARLLRL